MLTKLLKRKISSNFIFDGMMLMFINFSLLFSFGIIFGFCLFVEIIFSRLDIKMLFPPSVFIVLFGLISIYIWFIFGKEINRALKTKKIMKFLIINLIGSSPIFLILIYENLLIGIREMRGSSGCVNGLVAFSSIALGSMIFQFIFLLGGVLWANEN